MFGQEKPSYRKISLSIWSISLYIQQITYDKPSIKSDKGCRPMCKKSVRNDENML